MHFRTLLLVVVAILTASACSRTDSSASAATNAPASPVIESQAATNAVVISEQVAAQAGIETAPAAPAVMRTTLTLFGSIHTEPQRLAEVSARYPGVIRNVLTHIGDRVHAGAALANVESNESLQIYAVTAPIAGVVTQRHANVGELAGSEPLFEIVDASIVRVDLEVFPQDRAKLKLGQKVRVTSTDAETASEGTLAYISPLGSAATQSVTARVSLDNRSGRWTPGQFVTADVILDESRAAVTVAPTAIQNVNGRPVVFVRTAQGFSARDIEIGRRSAASIEIARGLEAGDVYAAKNTFLLKAELLKNEAEED